MDNAIPFPAAGRGPSGPSTRDLPLAAIPRIARICALGLGLDELLEEACREVFALCDAQGGCLVALREDGSREECWPMSGRGCAGDRPCLACSPERLAEFRDRLLAEGILVVEDSETLPPGDLLKEVCAFQGARSALFLALKFRTRILGLLSLHDPAGPRSWTEGNILVLRDVAAPILSAALERRKIERKLRESEARYRFLADHSLDFISLQNPDGRCLFASRAAQRMLGYRPEEMIGAPISGFLHPADLEGALEANRRLSAGEVPALVHEHRMRRKDGSYAEVETVASAIAGEEGDVRQILRVTRDITERRTMERRLHESQTFETIGMLAGGVAHEFNNLLVAVEYGVEALKARIGETAAEAPLLRMMERSAGRAVELTRQLLAYARRGKYAPEVVLLGQVVGEDLPVLRSTVPPSVELNVVLAEDVPPVLADITQLKQVLMSLCLNAVEAMPDGGVLTIRTHRTVKGGGGSDGGGALPAYAVLEVGDTGCGMDAETLSRVFDPFFSTKFVGRGMGLAAVRGIVENHGGEIRVSSEAGKGTIFTATFPGTAGDVPRRGRRDEIAMRWSGTVLIADDEPDVRAVLRAMLRSYGFEVVETCDGREAVDRFREAGGKFDLVILDLMMPRMTGEEAIGEIRKEAPDVPAILVSGYDESGRIPEIISRGFGAFLQKPFHRGDLARKVGEVLGHAVPPEE